MEKLLICLFICAMSSTGFAAGLSGSIAIELQEQGKFTGVIGKTYITEQSVEVVTFAEQNGEVVPFAFIYGILEKENKSILNAEINWALCLPEPLIYATD